MDDFHQRLVRVGLAAADRYGFALAGGYAVQAAGLVQRPSEDVDLFTAWERRGEFATALNAVVDAYQADGLKVATDRSHDLFARLTVTDSTTGRESKVELGADWRAHPPVRMALGPVLHPDDAVANKMCALFGRAWARDFIDIDAAITSGRYTREQLLVLAASADAGFDRQIFANALAQAANISADDFFRYGVTDAGLKDLRDRFADWRTQLIGSAGES